MKQLIDKLSEYFEAHAEELITKYEGKIIVMSSDIVITSFESYELGYRFGITNYGYGNFLLKECSLSSMYNIHVINPLITIAL